jgi:hypothetical protein
MNADYSRTQLLASVKTTVTGDLLSHLEMQVVIVSCDAEPAMLRSVRILLTTLRRLPVILAFDNTGVAEADRELIEAAVLAVNPEKPLQDAEHGFRVHIGLSGPAGAIRVVPSRHGAHVLRDERTVAVEPASALGSCMAAAFAAAEVFKAIVQVRPERRFDVSYAFCPVTLTDQPESVLALELPLTFSGALVGLGAIGTATAMILGEFGTCGTIDLVDRQRYGTENVTTYSLGGHLDAEDKVWKSDLAERALRNASCVKYNDGVEDYVAKVQNGTIAPPRIVLAGLDNIEARHETQRLWPDLLIDGATGDTMLGLHVAHGAGQPCMQCFLPKPENTISPYERLSALTGLPIEKLRRGDDVVREVDLDGLSQEQRARLEGQIGRKICGLAEAVGLTDLSSDGFQPSAAFVSLAAACLVVGRLVATELGIEPTENFVQYDALFGPGGATIDLRRPRASCYCVARATNIARVRTRRTLPPRSLNLAANKPIDFR